MNEDVKRLELNTIKFDIREAQKVALLGTALIVLNTILNLGILDRAIRIIKYIENYDNTSIIR